MVTQTRSSALKQEIERKLASRIPAALSPQTVQAPRLLPIENEAVNTLLGGGLPIGGICEFTGSPSAGRTSLALSVLSEATIDSACAYIDVSDSLDATSAAAAGVRLTNLLWVRFLARGPGTWKATTELLRANSINRLTSSNLASGRPLLGLLVHEDGSKFTPSHATKKGRRYPYYVSRPASGSKKIRRLPAVETELAVTATLRAFLSLPLELSKHFPDLRVQQTRLVVAAAQHSAEIFPSQTPEIRTNSSER